MSKALDSSTNTTGNAYEVSIFRATRAGWACEQYGITWPALCFRSRWEPTATVVLRASFRGWVPSRPTMAHCRTVPYRTVPYRTVPYRTVPCQIVPPQHGSNIEQSPIYTCAANGTTHTHTCLCTRRRLGHPTVRYAPHSFCRSPRRRSARSPRRTWRQPPAWPPPPRRTRSRAGPRPPPPARSCPHPSPA